MPPFPALPLPGISPALSIRQTFQVFNLNPCQLFDRLPDHIFAVGMHAPRPYRNALSPSPFSAKAAHRLPRQSARKRFSARLPVLPAFISQNLRIILTHNHRRRCGNDFIADARAHASRRFFAKSSTVDVSVSRISNSAARPEMMLETSPPLMRAACMVSIQAICRLAAVNVKIRIKPPEPGNRPHQHLVGVKGRPTASTRAPERLPPSAGQTPVFAFVDNNADIAAHVIVKHYADVQLRIARHKRVRFFAALFFAVDKITPNLTAGLCSST